MSGSLNNSQCEIMAKVLEDLNIGNTVPNEDWFIFRFSEGNTPDNCITVYNTTGTTQGATQIDGVLQIHHGIQIRIRGDNPKTAYSKANEIAVALDGLQQRNVTIESTNYVVAAARRTSDVLDLGNEVPTSKRRIFTINAIVALHQTN